MTVATAKRSMPSSLRSLPFAGQVLLAWTLFAGVGRAATFVVGVQYERAWYGSVGGVVWLVYGVPSLVCAGLSVVGTLRLVQGRTSGRGTFIAAWVVSAVLSFLWHLLVPSPALGIGFGLLFMLPYAFVQAAFVVVVARYVSEELTAGPVGGPGARDEARPAPGPARLPRAARALGVYVLLAGLGRVRGLLPAVRMYGEAAVIVLMGAVGFVGAIAFRAQREWGRWVLMGFLVFTALGSVGAVTANYAQEVSHGGGLLGGLQPHWSLVRGFADAFCLTAFLVGYACSARVRRAMRRSGR